MTNASEFAATVATENRPGIDSWCSGPQTTYPRDACIHQIFEAHVERAPDAIAAVFEGRVLSYRELNRRANRLAHRLLSSGVGPDAPVGIIAEQGLDTLIGMLAILKAGGAYVPLDPCSPEKRLQRMLEDIGARCLVATEQIGQKLEFAGRVIPVDAGEAPALAASEFDHNPASSSSATSTAYVLFTSGTTGRPKGAAVLHRGVVRLVVATDYVEIQPCDRMLQVSNLCFDASTFEIWGALLNGARLVILKRETMLSPEAFASSVAREGITGMLLTTAIFHQMASAMPQMFRGLKFVLFGGEACNPKWVRQVLEHGAPERLMNAYGPTETAVIATCHLVHQVPAGAASLPIGRPIANTQVYLLDGGLRPVPSGADGEIYIGGDGVGGGYLNRPELTAERFVASPFASDPTDRLYRTGDRARLLVDGSLEFLGRVDEQVKLRGFRIEPAEIEAALADHPAVRHAVAVVREDVPGDKNLVAYVVFERAAPTVSELREFLLRRLPEYMVPASFVMLESLPLTPNGKVDRHMLPVPDDARPELREAFVPPRSDLEEAHAQIWSDVLNIDRVGVHDDFFSLGGHSLRAMQVASRIRERFHVDIPLKTFLERPTIAKLTAMVAEAQTAGECADRIEIEPRTTVAVMSFSQERLWFFHLLAPDSSVYNCPVFFAIRGLLDTKALERSLQELVRRHESLRTRFVDVGGQLMQAIGPGVPVPLQVTDLSELSKKEREGEVQRRIQDEIQRPFDLKTGPVFRAHLLRLCWNEHVLFLNHHHIVTDAWSMKLLFGELSELYRAMKAGSAPPLSPLPLQYADFASWQRRHARELDSELDWWRRHLAEAPMVLDLPTDRPRPTVQTFHGAVLALTIGRSTFDVIQALAAKQSATPSMVLLSAFVALIYRYTGQDDFLLGTLHANRKQIETEGVVGFFVDTLVLRCNLAGDPTFLELVKQMRDTSLTAYEHAVPFDQLVKAQMPERDLGHNPVIQVLFAPQPPEPNLLRLSDLNVKAIEVDPGKSAFDLTLFFWEGQEGLDLRLEYSTALFDRETIVQLGDHLCTLLDGAVRQPGQTVSTLPMLSEAERHRILIEWNDTRTAYPRDASVHQIFEAQVERTPDAIAATFEGEVLLYAELNCRANQLARRLRAHGVGPGMRVGIFVERSFDVLIGLLAILKAGGAYVPLDPDYPEQRLQVMLEESGVAVLVAKAGDAARLSYQGQIVDLTDASIGDEASDNLPVVTKAEDLAYVMFTSGSSGRPKGSAVPHRGIARLVLNTNYIELTPSDRVLQSSSLSFDTSTFEIWGALLHGARLVLLTRNVLLSPRLFELCVRREEVSVMVLSSAFFNRLAAVIPQAFSGLRYLIVGGEALDPKWIREVLQKGPPQRLINGYGPTENTTFSTLFTVREVPAGATSIPIGTPISNSLAYVLDGRMQPVPVGVAGELYVGGDGVAHGYVNRPEQTAERFRPNPFVDEPGARLYRTGDRARRLRDGAIDFLGRLDHQVKVRGFRIEPAEIEASLQEHPDVQSALVMAREDAAGDKQLVAYLVPQGKAAPTTAALREFLQRRLPDYMVPTIFVPLAAIPLNPNGKADRSALPAHGNPWAEEAQPFVTPRSAIEEQLCAIWRDVLGLTELGIDDPFFERGGDSLRMMRVQHELQVRMGLDVSIVTLFQHATIRQLAAHLRPEPSPASAPSAIDGAGVAQIVRTEPGKPLAGSIAIIGMVGRFPGARSTDALWNLLREGKEGIRSFEPGDPALGGPDAELAASPGFVPRCGFLDDAVSFDAGFFGFSPLDARLMDPQQRVFLECAWAALEDAGYDPARYRGAIGVFGGSGLPRYWLERVAWRGFGAGTSAEQRGIAGNPLQSLATQTSYKLGLRGPALTVQTACSTSLVAVHLACQSLLARASDMALAGGVSMFSLGSSGYVFEPGGILSPDGRCRPFDAQGRGTVPASGAGLVVLKRLEDALAHGDAIRAVIRGSAVNNDGSKKVSYMAPSVEGQRDVIVEAHAASGVSSDSITFVEAHGTATPVGDPIEVAALTEAFRRGSSRNAYCALGSIKSNLGHLDSAAGIAGLIKAAMAVERGFIPPTLHFERPNPAIKFDEGPFFVNTEPMPWRPSEGPRRAGVSSFGVGGTNAHVVLEQGPALSPSGPSRSRQILLLSARTAGALAQAKDNLIDHLRGSPDQPLADVAFTLQQGRAAFAHRLAVVSSTHEDACLAMSRGDVSRYASGVAASSEPKLCFMFPGSGTQMPGMGRELYQQERIYRQALDHCAELFAGKLAIDLRAVLFAEDGALPGGMQQMERPSLNMAVIFSTEYALMQLLISWGLQPSAVVGHSLGEYAAACLAGMFSLEDAVTLVALRGQLLDEIQGAGMLSVPLSEAALSARLGAELSIAAVNGLSSCVVSGPLGAIDSLREALNRDGIDSQRIPVAAAYHSAMVEPAARRLTEQASSLQIHPPRIPIISNLTGSWLTEADARDPGYWGRHLRLTVRFADGLTTLLANSSYVLVEVGPGKTLSSLARMHPGCGPERLIATTMTHRGSSRTDQETLFHALARLFCAGVSIDWSAFTKEEQRRRVPLPSYPFQRQTYVLERSTAHESMSLSEAPSNRPVPARGSALSAQGPIRTGAMPAAPAASSTAPRHLPPSFASSDDIAVMLADIWRALLGLDDIRPEDNFFDCGGNSLIAVQLRSTVAARLKTQLPLHALIEHPTFAELLAVVRKAGSIAPAQHSALPEPASARPRHNLVVCLQAGSTGRIPLFLLPPVGGTVFTYMELGRHFHADLPVYAFRSSGLEPGEPIYKDIHAMAARYLEEVLAIQTQGPYILGGHSGGGTISYEMASLLAQRGATRTLVWMADTGFTTQYQRMNVTSVKQVLENLKAFKDIAPSIWQTFTTALTNDAVLREIVVRNYEALASYRPGRTAADVVYIRARERDAVLDLHPESEWMELVDGAFTAHNGPGNHLSMIEAPCAAALARIVQQHVDQFLGDDDLARYRYLSSPRARLQTSTPLTSLPE